MVLSTAILVIFVVPIVYVFTRFKFWGSKMILNIYMACIFLQASYIMVPFAIGWGVAAVRDSDGTSLSHL